MRRIFASLQHPEKYAYVFDSNAYNSHYEVCEKFLMYETYGDGLTAHSRDWPITREFMADYLASLATAILADTSDELVKAVSWNVRHAIPSRDQIEFAASIVYKVDPERSYQEKKKRWFSLSEQKISSSPAKEHDNRYTEVSPAHDGSPTAIYGILLPSYAKDLERYACAEAIRDWTLAHQKTYMPLAAEFLKWHVEDREESRILRYAFQAVLDLINAYHLRDHAQCHLSNISRSRVPKEVAA